ncbi:MAG TPA: YetF domain-containing protein [Acidimicrobiales bacterium]|jgi:uncharacterized membrane protein YcaP (DUF421 family)|nr:YetF domain-containing protein [Acidimicrobiales bacterium]
MDAVLRTTTIYLFLLVLFRLAGKRTLGEVTPFEFVLLLVIGEGTQQGLLGDDVSVTNALVVVSTFIALNVGLNLAKHRLAWLERVVEGVPVVVFADGQPVRQQMDRARINESDILEAAREKQGLERLDQIKYAVLERSGGISIIPR